MSMKTDLVEALEALLGHNLLKAVTNAPVCTVVHSNPSAHCLQGEQGNCGRDACRPSRPNIMTTPKAKPIIAP